MNEATKVQIDEFYAKTAAAFGVVTRDEAGDLWIRILADRYTLEELEAALETYASDTTIDDRGYRRGARMPAPADLKDLIDRKRRKRIAASPQYCGGPNCTEGWVVVDAASRRVAKCPDCAKLQREAKQLARRA
jgi:hypothetical protein